MTPEQLKHSILKSAFSGKLVEPEANANLPKVKKVEFDEPPFDIPDSWVWSTLGYCCEMYTGNSISESVKKAKYTGISDGLDYIATKDVTFSNAIIYDNGVRIPIGEGFKVAKSGAILMCIEGGSAGRKIGIIDRDVCFGNKLCMFNSDLIANQYIFFFLQSYEFKQFFSGNMSGIIGGVSIKKLKDLPIPIPPITEQLRIVEKIKTLLPYVDRYTDAYSKLEQFNNSFPNDMRKAILQYAVQGKLVEQNAEDGTGDELYNMVQAEKQKLIREGKISKEKALPPISEEDIPFDIPDSWKWVYLLDVVEEKPTNGFSQKGVDYQTSVRNLTLTATTSGYFKADAFKYVDIQLEADSKYWLKKGDLLIQRSNSRELVGTSCIYTGEDNAFIYPDLMMKLRVMNNVDVKYVDYVLKSPLTRSYFSKNASGTSESMPKINQGIVSATLVPLPPLAEQKRIVAKIEELLPLCEKLVASS